MVSEADLVVVLWANHSSPHGRPFETMTRSEDRIPLAWSLDFLQKKYSSLLKDAYLVLSRADFDSWTSQPLLSTVTREKPLLVPVPIAREALGWQFFDVLDEV